MYKKLSIILIVFGLVAMSFLFGYSVREINISRVFLGYQETDFPLIMEAYGLIKNKFINPGSIDDKKLIHGAIEGMVDSLNDPYTTFFNLEDTKRFLDDSEGKFEGVGMEVGLRNNQFQVIAPIKGMPADRAGLLPGDWIMKIDGIDIKGMSAEEAVNLIRGPKGTQVILTILREGWDEPRDIQITRDVIELVPMEWRLIDGEIAYISLFHFSMNADADFKKIALDVLDSQAKGIVLDLRGNPGGHLDVAKRIGEWLMERGDVFVIEDSIIGRREMVLSGNGRLSEYPIVVLINEGSASASEILAGALRDNRGVVLIGKKSFGKGSIQSFERLSDGSSIKMTIARWLTPSGEVISEKGLIPDVEIEMTSDDYEADRDPQLDKAIEVIEGMI